MKKPLKDSQNYPTLNHFFKSINATGFMNSITSNFRINTFKKSNLLSRTPKIFQLMQALFLFASFLFQVNNVLAQSETNCPLPTGYSCGSHPQYACNELTYFVGTVVPNQSGTYNINVKAINNLGSSNTFFLMSGGSIIGTPQSGSLVTFSGVSPGCYRLLICTITTNGSYYCCQDLPCNIDAPGCNGLNYGFFTNQSNPSWNLGDDINPNLNSLDFGHLG
jgi:hypothetical protein